MSLMGRRRFLNTLAGLGISGSALSHMSQEALAEVTNDPNDEVPRLSALRHKNHEEFVNSVKNGKQTVPEREPVYYTIPRDVWRVNEGCMNAAKRIQNRLRQLPETKGVSAFATKTTSGQQQKHAVSVKYTTATTATSEVRTPDVGLESLKEELPAETFGVVGQGKNAEKVQGFPIIFEEFEKQEDQADYYDDNYDPVGAGCCVDVEDNDKTTYYTYGTPAKNSQGTTRGVTAGHCVEYASADKWHQPYQLSGPGNWIGDRIDSKYRNSWDSDNFDAGVMQTVDANWKLVDDYGGYKSTPIVGVIGRDELVDNQNSSYKISKQGATLGTDSGYLQDVSTNGFVTDAPRAGGDSGGPHFKKKTYPSYGIEEYYIVGIHHGGTDNVAVGTIMEQIESEYGLTV